MKRRDYITFCLPNKAMKIYAYWWKAPLAAIECYLESCSMVVRNEA